MAERPWWQGGKLRYIHLLVAILLISALLIAINYEQVYAGVAGFRLVGETQLTETVAVTDATPAPPPALMAPAPIVTEDPGVKLARELPNVPLAYWDSVRDHASRIGWPKLDVCARLPWIDHIQFNNVFWQSLVTPNVTYNFLNAYYDNRIYKNNGPSVRIIAMVNSPDPPKVFCQFWFDGDIKPLIVESEEHYLMWHWGKQSVGVFHPYLITCPVSTNRSDAVPRAVALAASKCDAVGNLLRVIYDPLPTGVVRNKFAVCVKGLDFPDIDIAPRLAEWLELVTLLGADQVIMYRLQVHPHVDLVLNYYASKGVVSVVPSTLAGGLPNYPLLQHTYLKNHWISLVFNEIVELNDCFYRNLYSHEYVVILDTDEVIMPLGDIRSWHDLLDAVHANNTTHASFNTRNIYFFDTHMTGRPPQPDVPAYMHILQHVVRAKNFRAVGEATKSFFRTSHVIVVHNHYPLHCFGDWCDNHPFDVKLAMMAHYKDKCAKAGVSKEICKDFDENVVTDMSAWRFKDELISGTRDTLQAVGLPYT